MLKRLLFSICMICSLLAGCTDDDRMPSSAVIPSPAGTVSVKLHLDMEAYGTPFSVGTRAGGEHAALSVSNEDMDIELVEAPITRAAEDKETSIYKFTLFQFDGITDASKLIGMETYDCPGGVIKTDEVTVQLTESQTAPGTYIKHRFVVITNTKSNDFSDLTLSISTYTDFQNLCVTKAASIEPLFPLRNLSVSGQQKVAMMMCGTSNAVVESVGKQLIVTLQRTVAKVKFNITGNVETTGAFDKWDVSLMNIPNRSFYNIQGRFPVFPATSSTTLSSDFWVKQFTSTDGNQLPVNTDELYIPINLQATVNSCTAAKRRDYAPFGGTYLQIMGRKMSDGAIISLPVVTDYVLYQIYLGNNLSTDFSVSPNCNLTYNITLKGRHTEDANVVRFVPGYFSGKLTAYDEGGSGLTAIDDPTAVKWKYSRKMEAYFGDAGYPSTYSAENLGRQDVRWYVGSAYSNMGATSLMDGHANTSKLQSQNTFQNYPAALSCYMGLNELNLSGQQSFTWYLPSIGELIGTWISTASTVSQLNTSYWSSTALSGEAKAYIMTNKGEVKTAPVNSDGNRHYVRGFRDADAISSGQ